MMALDFTHHEERDPIHHGLTMQIFFFTLILALLAGGCSTATNTSHPTGLQSSDRSAVEERFGIEVQSLRLTAADTMLDFRYKIIDPDKAVVLVDRTNKPYLIDQASGLQAGVPSPGKLGPLRATDKYGKPKVDRTYFVLFTNPNRQIKEGDKVTVVIGNFRAEDLVVQ